MGNFFAVQAATDQRLLKRSCESLLGICSGMLCDGQLTDQEIRFLDLWLSDNSDIANSWPGEVLVARVKNVLQDGIITDEERTDLTKTLADLIGGSLEETGATSGLATRLPLDDIGSIEIPGRKFCFTGTFLYGTRPACEKAVTQRGGLVAASVRLDLNYLVIGTMATRSWANTSHGRKIEKAVEYKQDGSPIFIVSEEQWVRHL
jgi:NAD-dependent DNA ligase